MRTTIVPVVLAVISFGLVLLGIDIYREHREVVAARRLARHRHHAFLRFLRAIRRAHQP